MTNDRLEFLLQTLAAGNLDAQQTKELQDLLANNKESAEIRKWMENKMQDTPSDLPYDANRFDALFNEIINVDRSFAGEAQPTKVRSLSFHWIKYAAAVIIVVTAGWFFWDNKEAKVDPVVSHANVTTPDLVAGSDKAILTLSDGSKVEVKPSQSTFIDGTLKIGNKENELDYSNSVENLAGREPLFNTMTTPRGGQYKLRLPDGTKVWLNASSSITFPTFFVGNDRKVQITGEVYMEVQHDPSKPFHVVTDQMDIEVLGTHFNVNAYGDEPTLSTTLLEGSVKINQVKTSGSRTVVLKPGEQAQISKNETEIKVLQDADVEQIIAWKNGINSFRNSDIKTMMRQVSRWYDVDVEYEGVIPESKKFTGEFSRNDNASKIFNMLDYAGIHCRIEGKKVIVMQ